MLSCFDFCSGIGSAHQAFQRLGCEFNGYSEINEKAEKTYQLFNGDKYKNYGDLTKINADILSSFDIMLAGFPCQTFSIVGQRKGFNDERGQIIYSLAKILKQKQPKAFLFENVKGLVNHNNGNTLKTILSLLQDCEYVVDYKVLSSEKFGIPQLRERIYFVGIRTDLYKRPFTFPTGTTSEKNISDFLSEIDDKFLLKGENYNTFLRYLNNKYNKGKFNLEDILKQDYLVLDTRQSDLRLYKNVIPTLRTGRQGILYIKNGKIRKLSGREALLLQGFSLEQATMAQETFKQTDILAQAGNAMTINVMYEIGKKLVEYLQ